MMTRVSRWIVPVFGFVLAVLIGLALMGQNGSPLQVVVSVAVAAAYAVALLALQSRSDVASVLSGLPPDERWESINLRALSIAAQVIAVALVGAFLAVGSSGGDAMPYAWLGVVFAASYIGGLAWYRIRS
jgi:hypothetical protein